MPKLDHRHLKLQLSGEVEGVLVRQQGNSHTELPSTGDISGSFFKVFFVLYNLLALSHLVGTVGFWRMFYSQFWKWRLASPRREMGVKKIIEAIKREDRL